jgi:hypothetical protein
MWFQTLFNSLRSSRTSVRRRQLRQRPHSVRPRLESLEDRNVPSTFTVDHLADDWVGSGLNGSLRYCINQAADGDHIRFGDGVTGTMHLAFGLGELRHSISIDGPGPGLLTVTAAVTGGTGGVGLMVAWNATVSISGVTLIGGYRPDGLGSAITNDGTLTVNHCTVSGSSGPGAAILNEWATLTLNDCTVTGNSSFTDSAIDNWGTSTLTLNDCTVSGNSGRMVAGITNGDEGTATLSDCTVSGNSASGADPYYYCAGGILNGGALSMNNCTVSGNSDFNDGEISGAGGIFNANILTLNNCTISGNSGFFCSGLYTGWTAQTRNTIIAGNMTSYWPGSGDVCGDLGSLGHNLIGDGSGYGFDATDILNVDPKLGALQNNGGPTQTMALLPGSPAIDAGDNTNAPAFDQRGPGFARIVNGVIDIGAYEVQNLSLVVSGFPAAITAGSSGSLTVTAQNADGSTDTNYTGTVHFTSSDVQAVLPADYTFTAADAGVHTFAAALKTAGTQSLTVTDTTMGGVAGGQSGITVTPAGASTVSITGFPSPATAGVTGYFKVTVTDPYGNIASGYTGTVHFTSSDARASLPADYAFTAADAGVHTFGAALKTAGLQSITATDATTPGPTGSDRGIAVNPAAASQFIITAPSSVSAGAAFNLTLTVEDAYGNVVTGYTGTVHFSSTDSAGALPSNYAFSAADSGMHTFTRVVLRKRGYQKITITDTNNSSLFASVILDVL